MMRFLFLILLIFPLFVFAEPGKVVGVIPVKFNSKGMHAPVPYNQQLMNRGWTRVPTLNLPFTFAGGAGQNPRYQPTKVTKKSFSRALGYAAGRVANMTPAGKALLIAYGAYEANCISENYPSLCIDNPDSGGYDLDDFKLADDTELWCSINYPSICSPLFDKAVDMSIEHFLKGQILNTADTRITPSLFSKVVNQPSVTFVYSLERYEYRYNGATLKYEWTYISTTKPTHGLSFTKTIGKACPPRVHQDYNIGPYKVGSEERCYKPDNAPIPVTPEWIEDQIEQKPQPVVDSDVGLDDFVDWETGLPRPDAFEEPTYDPVSPAFAEAAEAIANGTVQHDNPNGNGYVPREMMPNLLVQINNWHEGNTFIDVYSGKEVKPDAPPPEESKIDWTKFPGITKAQYEASNNAWGKSAADQAPNINDEISKGEEEFTKLKETINDVPDKTPFVMDFADLVIFPSGGCKGFTVAASLAGQPKSIIVDKHCPPYDAWGRGFIEWILFVATAFQIFHIFRRTLEVV